MLLAGKEEKDKNIPEHYVLLTGSALKRNYFTYDELSVLLLLLVLIRVLLNWEKENTQFQLPLAILLHLKGGGKIKKKC